MPVIFNNLIAERIEQSYFSNVVSYNYKFNMNESRDGKYSFKRLVNEDESQGFKGLLDLFFVSVLGFSDVSLIYYANTVSLVYPVLQFLNRRLWVI